MSLRRYGTVWQRPPEVLGECVIIQIDFIGVVVGAKCIACARLAPDNFDWIIQTVRTREEKTALTGWTLYLYDEFGIDDLGLVTSLMSGPDEKQIGYSLGANAMGAREVMGMHYFYAETGAAALQGQARFYCLPPNYIV